VSGDRQVNRQRKRTTTDEKSTLLLSVWAIARVGGPKHAKLAQRQGNWHGSAPGSVVLGGRRVPVERPRGRTVAGDEIELAAYAAFSQR
jgi:hypothetical protein